MIVEKPLLGTVHVQFTARIWHRNQIMPGPDIDFPVRYDRRSELDAVSWRISRIGSTVVKLIGEIDDIVGARGCGRRGSAIRVLVLKRLPVVNDPQDSIRIAIGRDESRRAIAADLHGGYALQR